MQSPVLRAQRLVQVSYTNLLVLQRITLNLNLKKTALQRTHIPREFPVAEMLETKKNGARLLRLISVAEINL